MTTDCRITKWLNSQHPKQNKSFTIIVLVWKRNDKRVVIITLVASRRWWVRWERFESNSSVRRSQADVCKVADASLRQASRRVVRRLRLRFRDEQTDKADAVVAEMFAADSCRSLSVLADGRAANRLRNESRAAKQAALWTVSACAMWNSHSDHRRRSYASRFSAEAVESCSAPRSALDDLNTGAKKNSTNQDHRKTERNEMKQ